jgi:glycosyltransferase involved in cell wall biosynthesis
MKISVIVSTYNQPQALKLCLLSLVSQSIMPYDILIADDGSTAETRDTVLEMQQKLKHAFPVKHIWHEDIGFRKPKILNEAVRRSTADYLVFIDGDCMAHRHFIRSHVENSSPDAILSGKRVEIGKELTRRLLDRGTTLNSFNLTLLWDAAMSRSRKVEEAIMIRNRYLRRVTHRDRITDDGVWGCNCSLYKKLFIDINGYDEDFQYAIEDNDLGIRVLNQGKKVKSVRGLAIIFHLWHPVRWNFHNEKYMNDKAILERRIANREPVCKNGIRKL